MTMTQTARVPDKNKLAGYLDRKMTQAQIVAAWEDESGMRVSRSAIAMAIERYGLKSANPRPTYHDMLPWRIATEHQMHHDARMLRLESQRRAGKELDERDARHLNAWLEQLADSNAVVHYERDTEEGFFWVSRNEVDVAPGEVIDRSNADYR